MLFGEVVVILAETTAKFFYPSGYPANVSLFIVIIVQFLPIMRVKNGRNWIQQLNSL
jgi:hypothetical protein